MGDNYKSMRVVIQLIIILTFVFGVVVATIAYNTASLTMGLIFLTAIQIIVLLSILYMLEVITEILETKR